MDDVGKLTSYDQDNVHGSDNNLEQDTLHDLPGGALVEGERKAGGAIHIDGKESSRANFRTHDRRRRWYARTVEQAMEGSERPGT